MTNTQIQENLAIVENCASSTFNPLKAGGGGLNFGGQEGLKKIFKEESENVKYLVWVWLILRCEHISRPFQKCSL